MRRSLIYLCLVFALAGITSCAICNDGLQISFEDQRPSSGEPKDYDLLIKKTVNGKTQDCGTVLKMSSSAPAFSQRVEGCDLFIMVHTPKKFVIQFAPTPPTKLILQINQDGKVLISKTIAPDYALLSKDLPEGQKCRYAEDTIVLH